MQIYTTITKCQHARSNRIQQYPCSSRRIWNIEEANYRPTILKNSKGYYEIKVYPRFLGELLKTLKMLTCLRVSRGKRETAPHTWETIWHEKHYSLTEINNSVLKDVEEINLLPFPGSAKQHTVQQVYRLSSALYLSPQFLIRDVPVLLHQVFDLSQNPVHLWRRIRPQFSRLWNRLDCLHNLSEGKIQVLTKNILQWSTERCCYENQMPMWYVLHKEHLKKTHKVPFPRGILEINISHVILRKKLHWKGGRTKESLKNKQRITSLNIMQ